MKLPFFLTALALFSGNALAQLPSPWSAQDIGSVGVSGTSTHTSGTFTVEGSGADISGAADAFQFVFQPVTGDCDIRARVVSVENTNTLAKAGVMIRQTLDADAIHAAAVSRPSLGGQFVRRTSAGGGTSVTGVAAASPPRHLRLLRLGDTFTAYHSADGTTWTEMGSETLAMTGTIYVGMAVTAKDNATLCTGTLDQASVDTTLSGLTISNIPQLQAVAGASERTVTMQSGTYWLTGPATRPSPYADYPIFLDLSGTNTTFDFTGVHIKVDTAQLDGYGSAYGHSDTVRVLQVSGTGITVRGLTLSGEVVGTEQWADWSTTFVELIGSEISIEDCVFTTRGSFPYGPGDAFGKGAAPTGSNQPGGLPFKSHSKHSGIRAGKGASDITLDDVQLHMRTYGHGIFFQQGSHDDILVKDCLVSGDAMTNTNDIIGSGTTPGIYDQQASVSGTSVWLYQFYGYATYGEALPANVNISKHEDGVRVYGWDATFGWVHDVTVQNTVVERMRDAFATGDMGGALNITSSEAWQCENGFAPANPAVSGSMTTRPAITNTITGCKGDARNGPLLFFRRSGDNVTASVEVSGTNPPQGDWPIALISGSGNNVTITGTTAGIYPATAYVNVSQAWREWRHNPATDIDASATGNSSEATVNNTIINTTGQPLVFGLNATSNTGTSTGGVINKGSNNIYTGTTIVPARIETTDTWGTYLVYSGTQIASSTLSLGGTNATDSGTVVSAGGRLEISPTLQFQGEPLVLSGSGAGGQGALFSSGTTANTTRFNSSNGTIALAGDTAIGVGTSGSNQFLIGAISGTGNLTKVGQGILTMENGGTSNSFSGSLTIAAGSVLARSNKALNDLFIAAGAAFLGNGDGSLSQSASGQTVVSGTLDVNNRTDATSYTIAIGKLGGTGVITAANTSGSSSNFVTVNSTTEDSLFSGVITGSRLGLVKSGAGTTLTLTGSNSYALATTVNAGTLAVNGRISSSSAVTVNSGGTLVGTGTTGGVTINSGATLAPGGSVGKLTTDAQTWKGGGAMNIEINDAAGTSGGPNGWDRLTSTGIITLDATLTSGTPFQINVSGLTAGGATGVVPNFDNRQGYAWLVASASTLSGSFSPAFFPVSATDFAANNPVDHGTFQLSLSGGNITLDFTPSGYAAWKLTKGIAAAVAATSDLDGNGVQLLNEYALAIEPGASGGLPVAAKGAGSAWDFTFNRARAELFYDVYVSTNLTGWTLLETNPGSPGGNVTVSFTPPAPGDRCFFRLQVRFQ